MRGGTGLSSLLEAGGLEVQSQPEQQSEIKTIMGDLVRPYLKIKNAKRIWLVSSVVGYLLSVCSVQGCIPHTSTPTHNNNPGTGAGETSGSRSLYAGEGWASLSP